ncbi:Lipase [Trema orientale]|uniref:Lipase n=1 Tax=Trema orientale TaxID=63057 RepID=A0A2P5FR67_TREOI|nr:Lipase [Trema orientale]
MAATKKRSPSLSEILLIISLLLSCFSQCSTCSFCNTNKTNEHDSYKTKGMFVFGSSLVDNGNNNFIKNSLAKANYLPYGLDFPLGPSGRFTNGKNVIDLLGEKLQLPSFLPAFADPSTKGRRIVHGVSFASGASGILDDTGSIAGNVTSLSEQIRNMEEVTLPELEAQLGCKSTQVLGDYLFVVGSGSNDYSFNYFLRGLNRNLTLQAFTSNLTASLSHNIKQLYSLGARKFVLLSINPIGCSPMVRTMVQPTQNRCVQGLNLAAQLFNSYLKSLVDNIKPELPGSTLVYVNTYKIIRDIIRNPSSKGFKEAGNPCCEVASLSEGGNGVLCKRGGQVCANRSSHVFFDGLHPTEAVNVQIVNKAYASTLKSEVSNCSFPEDDSSGAETKGMFVFGSSLVDNGNNNFFENRAKADYSPYGIDFPSGPSGRFTNGKNLIDLLGEHLKLPNLIPPFKDPSTKGNKIVHGVNHASGSSGILDDTGLIAGNVTSLSQQIRDFEEVTLPELEAQLGCRSSDSLPNYLFVVGVGGNDIVFNYFLRNIYLRVDPLRFTANLTATLATHLQKLYSLGGRRFVLTAIYPVGNSPMVELNMPDCAICAPTLNQAAELYNRNLIGLVANMENQMPGSHIGIVNTYNIVQEILLNPTSKGGNGVLCERGGKACVDRSAYVYFDALHPTEAVNVQIASEAYASHNRF